MDRTVNVTYTIPDTREGEEFLRDIFITALEGGIGYWATCEAYQWQVWPFHAVISADDDGTEHNYVIDPPVIMNGIRRILSGECLEWVSSDLRATLLEATITLDAGDIDANDADSIVQAGVFNRIIYG